MIKEDQTENLKQFIQCGGTDKAIALIREAKGYHEAEQFVKVVLGEGSATPEMLEAALETFLGTRENRYQQHGYWVHSLSHFTNILWERRMVEWIKKFNEVAFKGANELDDSNCSDRLVGDFATHAKFDDNPTEFHLTSENLRWMKWEYATYAQARLERSPFQSEESFLRWEFLRPEIQKDYYCGWVNTEALVTIVKRLEELGADVTEVKAQLHSLLSNDLSKLEKKLAEEGLDRYLRTVDFPRRVEAIKKALAET